jgi:hypothetical protein
MLRLASYYTPSHADMFRRFVLPGASAFYETRILRCEQTCPTGSFKSPGWNACMLDKLRALMSLPMDGMPTLYVDADVVLLPGMHRWASLVGDSLGTQDVAFSDDAIQWCCGVMLFRCTPEVREFWNVVWHLANAWNIPDQDVIHSLRSQAEQRRGFLPVQPHILDPNVVCNWATVNAPTVPAPWDGEPIEVPESCMAWHANFVVGVERKTAMLEAVAHGRQHCDD